MIFAQRRKDAKTQKKIHRDERDKRDGFDGRNSQWIHFVYSLLCALASLREFIFTPHDTVLWIPKIASFKFQI
jgi:hypothetical protein